MAAIKNQCAYGEWMLLAIDEKQRNKPKQQKFRQLHDPLRYDCDDYAVRQNGNRYESYNTRNGAVLYSYPVDSFTEQEAWDDIRAEFNSARSGI